MKIYKKPLMKPHKLRMEAMICDSTDPVQRSARGGLIEDLTNETVSGMED